MARYLLIAAISAVASILLSPFPAKAFDSFGFYCAPYTKSFEEGKHYIASSTNPAYIPCTFNIPAAATQGYNSIHVAVFKGTVGDSQLAIDNSVSAFFPLDQPLTLYNVDFILSDGQNPVYPKQDDNFFAVMYDGGFWDNGSNATLTQFQSFFTSGGIAPNNNYQIIRWKWGAKPQSEWDPVVIIPGILGSWKKDGQWILDPMAHVYDNLVDTLKTNGYVENKTLFTFPYDWEKSNVDTAKLLAQKISDIKSICGCDKVDLVAHSMGGLVATQYIESSDYKDDVDQLFTLGTPLAGAPKAYKAWEAGQMELGDFKVNVFLQRIFSREAADSGYGSVFDYIHQKPVPSVQELLPVFQNYLRLGSSLLQFPTGYPANSFLQNLIGDPGAYYSKVLNKVQTYVVVGDTGAASTTIGYTVKNSTQLPFWQDGEVVSSISGEGDSTVPADSAIYFSGPDEQLRGVEHMNLPTASEGYVIEKLTGTSSFALVNKKYDFRNADWALAASKIAPSPGDFNILIQTLHDAFLSDIVGHTVLFFMLFSPVDVKITTPDGNQIGKNFSTGANINQIPGATYSGPIGEHEYVVIEDPLPGQYKVETVGTGNGAYTVAAGLIDQVTTSVSLVSGTTSVDQIISNTLFVSSTSTSLTLTPPLPPVATSTPTTTELTPETCITDLTKAYQDHWIGKKQTYERLTADCQALKGLFKAKNATKTKFAKGLIDVAIRLTLANMELLARDKNNTEDAVSLITKYITWFKNNESH